MAGGMGRGGDWGPMSERVQSRRTRSTTTPPGTPEGQSAAQERSPDTPREPTAPPSALKHCFVTDEHGTLPALLLEWRRRDSGDYQGRVVRPVLDDQWGWVVVEEWLPAAMLTPA